jgi:3-hydroxyacyl-[acyl-carrier protein] dehydratase/trans-2-decenoyl-[acyl-carrier protein] isomerase
VLSYEEFRRRSSFTQVELVAFAHGTLINDAPEGFACRLPLPPLLQLDRVIDIRREGQRGRIVAEREVGGDDWFLQRHFKNDPVMPGCLSIEALWQMMGFFCAWSGGIGCGRALGCKEMALEEQILPADKVIRYEVDVRRFTLLKNSGAAIAVGNGAVFVNGRLVCSVEAARVGTFSNAGASGSGGDRRDASIEQG